jgi:hypothetical protein
VATPTLSGGQLLTISLLVIDMLCYSIYLAKDTSQINGQVIRYSAAAITDQALVEISILNYVQRENHLMDKEIADHLQILVVIKFQLMILVETCLLTCLILPSQYLN